MSKLRVIRGSAAKPVISGELADLLEAIPKLEGLLWIGFPILRPSTQSNCIDAVLIHAKCGVIAFDLIESDELGGYQKRQDDIFNDLDIKLRREPKLRRQKELMVDTHIVSYSSLAKSQDSDDKYPVLNQESLVNYLESLESLSLNENPYRLTLSVLESVSELGKSPKPRKANDPESLGSILKGLEDSIATLDWRQRKAAFETVHGVQRIRGLAGSGKTIVLALKAAYLHSQNLNWKIGVTFHTRSLKPFFRKLIEGFYFRITESEPNWDNLIVIHSWGSAGAVDDDGIYHEFCVENGIECLDFRTARNKFGPAQAFDGACQLALKEATNRKQNYDLILVDEAQDLPPSFLKLCYEFLHESKRLVYAYDELQNLNRASLPSPEKIFGRDRDNNPLVTFGNVTSTHPTSDLILNVCYRTPRPILVTAHAIGFGVYRCATPPLVQMFDHPQLWKAVGYTVESGALKGGKNVTLARTATSSPRFLEEHSSLEDLIVFEIFDSIDEQARWVAESIQKNIEEDELEYTDIMVINPDPEYARIEVGSIRTNLMKKEIHSHFAGVDTKPDIFMKNDIESVTFSSIHRAKGNEAAMVYVVNAESGISSTRNLASVRNRLFAAITRSKAWVRVTGIGDEMRDLEREYRQLVKNNFKLSFRYPTAQQRKDLRMIHRDRSKDEQNQVNLTNDALEQILKHLRSIDKDDLDRKLANKVKESL